MTERDPLLEVFVASDRVVGRRIADEFLLVPLVGRGADVDSILNLNGVGTFIWERIDGHRTGAEIADLVTEHFEVESAQARSDVAEFLLSLESVAAIRRAPGAK